MSRGSPCSTRASPGYEHEEGHQHNYPDQAASTGRRTGGGTRKGGRDWSHYTIQPEGTIYLRTSRT